MHHDVASLGLSLKKPDLRSPLRGQFGPEVLPDRASAPTSISIEDMEEHTKDEAIIAGSWRRFVDVGLALRRIRDRRSYRHAYPTFEKYLSQRWNFGKTYAYRIINGAEVVTELSKVSKLVPQNEAQVRPLLGVPAEKLATVWEHVEKQTARAELTAELITTTARLFRPEAKSSRKAAKVESLPSEVVELFEALRQSISTNSTAQALQLAGQLQEMLMRRKNSGGNQGPV